MISTLFTGVTPLVLFLAKATFVLLAALVAASALRRSTAGARHLVWLAALVGVLALPLLARIPPLRLSILPAMVDRPTQASVTPSADPVLAAQPAQPVMPAIASVTASPSPARAVAERPARTRAPGRVGQSPMDALLIVWVGIALSLLGWLVAGAFQVRRIVKNGHELNTPDWTTPLCEVADRLDLDTPPRLIASDEIEMAFACRALEPTIVLPKSAQAWSDDRRRAVLFHELAHVKRHDLLGHTLGRIACALYWFHPLVWTAAKALRAESERACDDLVLSCGARPSEYAQHLLDMVTSVRHAGAPVMAMPMARKKEFEGRMLAILDPAIRRAAPGRAQAALVVATLGSLSLTVAAVSPAPAPVEKSVILSERGERRTPVPTEESQSPPLRSIKRDTTISEIADRPSAPVTEVLTQRTVSKTISSFATDLSIAMVNAFAGGMKTASAQGVDTNRVKLLIKVLETDTDASVRRSAAWALHDSPLGVAKNALIKALGHDADSEVREMAAWSLADFDTEQAASTLADALLKDKSARVRLTAAWALGNYHRDGAVDVLVTAVSDPDDQVRQAAIWALGQHDVRRAPASLMNALTDQSQSVRTTAAWTLGRIRDTASVKSIARAFETETDSRVRTAELWALMNMDTMPPSVMDAAMKSSDPELRRHAVALLAGRPEPWPWPWPWPWPRPSP